MPNRPIFRRILPLLLLLLLVPAHPEAAPFEEKDLPSTLRDWVPWVLYGEEERACPFVFDNVSARRCAWPSTLDIRTDDRGGRFMQTGQLDIEGWILLPSSPGVWPMDVRLDGKAAPVILWKERPSIRAARGVHRVTGTFEWRRSPEYIFIGKETGLVSGAVGGRKIISTDTDREGRLWLNPRKPGEAASQEERLMVQVFRRLTDDIPFRETTRFQLDVSGQPREVVLQNALLPGMVPLRLDGGLPMRMEPDGSLRLRVKPGTWTLQVEARSTRPVQEVTLSATPAAPAAEEIWLFEEQTQLRMVEVQGLTAVDPAQTNVPQEWAGLAAYVVHPGDTMKLVERERGLSHPLPNQLNIDRKLYLDFSGQGYSVQDHITGYLHAEKRLEALSGVALGRVLVDGEPQMITRREGSSQDGVEIRRGAVDLFADSRYEGSRSEIPVGGWDTNFRSVSSVELNLPPGWRLFGVRGPDSAPAWLSRWNLLDFFVVLLLVFACRHFWGLKGALLAAATLILTWKEPGSPKYLYLHLVASLALVRALPAGKLRRAAAIYRTAAILAFVAVTVPYVVASVRLALYPQLSYSNPADGYVRSQPPPPAKAGKSEEMVSKYGQPAEQEMPAVIESVDEAKSPLRKSLRRPGIVPSSPVSGAPSEYGYRYDKSALIQTGAGIPVFGQNRLVLRWDGPVSRDETMRLILFSPFMTGLWILAGVVAVLLLGFRLLGVDATAFRKNRKAVTAGFLLFCTMAAPLRSASAEIPSPELLAEMKKRLTAAPECAPECARSPRAMVDIGKDLTIRFSVESQADVAVPLPASPSNWMPLAVVVDGQPATGLYQENDILWAKVSPGVHQVVLNGPVGELDRFQLPLLMRPARVVVQARGWDVRGISPDGIPQGPIYFEKVQAAGAEEEAFEAGRLPPFVTLTRTLHIDLDFTVRTLIRRVTPGGEGINIEVPLLGGESVVTDGVRVEDGKAIVSLGAGQTEYGWSSVMAPREEISLAASTNTLWVETWHLYVSPIWHLEQASGIPEIHHGGPNEPWVPTWRPWPGEQVSLRLTRPEPVEGPTLTIDSSRTRVRPGKRETEVEVSFVARSSRGVQHTLGLPAGSELQKVVVDGKLLPIRANEKGEVVLALLPKTQPVEVTWLQKAPMGTAWETPSLSINAPSVNASVEVEIPRDRWVLLAGSGTMKLGPAVLIYGVLLVAVIAAMVLSLTTKSPLRFISWALLLIGFTQTPVWIAMVVVGWILLLSLRDRLGEETSPGLFNLVQVAIGLSTLMSLYLLYVAVSQSLLGFPEMWIRGNGSDSYHLKWYVDRANNAIPTGGVLSVPLFWYRILMLAWSLFVAGLILKVLRWGYHAFTRGGLWKKHAFRARKQRVDDSGKEGAKKSVASSGYTDAPGDETG